MPYKKKLPPLDPCPVELFTNLIGGKWKARIIALVAKGPRRFADLLVALPGVSQPVLSAQLKAMTQDGLLCRKSEGMPGSGQVFYVLGERAIEMMPVLQFVAAWGNAEIEKL